MRSGLPLPFFFFYEWVVLLIFGVVSLNGSKVGSSLWRVRSPHRAYIWLQPNSNTNQAQKETPESHRNRRAVEAQGRQIYPNYLEFVIMKGRDPTKRRRQMRNGGGGGYPKLPPSSNVHISPPLHTTCNRQLLLHHLTGKLNISTTIKHQDIKLPLRFQNSPPIPAKSLHPRLPHRIISYPRIFALSTSTTTSPPPRSLPLLLRATCIYPSQLHAKGPNQPPTNPPSSYPPPSLLLVLELDTSSLLLFSVASSSRITLLAPCSLWDCQFIAPGVICLPSPSYRNCVLTLNADPATGAAKPVLPLPARHTDT